MVQNGVVEPSSQNYLILKITYLLLILTFILHIIFGLNEFPEQTVDVFVHIKHVCNLKMKNGETTILHFSLTALFFIVTIVWLCDRRKPQDHLELCCLEEATNDVDLKFRSLEYVELKSATNDLPNKLQEDIDEFRMATQLILMRNTYNEIAMDSNYEL